jgi:transcriptional regulator with XRE-family HTH domain
MEAPRLFKTWKRERGFTNAIVSELLGVSEQTVNQWFSSRSRPTIYLQFAIEELTHREVSPTHWLTGEEKNVLAAFKRHIKKLRSSNVKPPPTAAERVAGRL